MSSTKTSWNRSFHILFDLQEKSSSAGNSNNKKLTWHEKQQISWSYETNIKRGKFKPNKHGKFAIAMMKGYNNWGWDFVHICLVFELIPILQIGKLEFASMHLFNFDFVLISASQLRPKIKFSLVNPLWLCCCTTIMTFWSYI